MPVREWVRATIFDIQSPAASIPSPSPTPDGATRERIRGLGEKLDAHRKRQQAAHPGLTLTGIYNVLEKLRAGDEALNPKEKKIHDEGLVSVLQQIHDDLDEAVFRAYGWDDLWQKLEGPAPSGPKLPRRRRARPGHGGCFGGKCFGGHGGPPSNAGGNP